MQLYEIWFLKFLNILKELFVLGRSILWQYKLLFYLVDNFFENFVYLFQNLNN